MSEKSFFDKIFDVADSALSPLETALSRDPAPQKSKPDNGRQEAWENTFETIQWGTISNVWHAFHEGSMSPICEPETEADAVFNRKVLEHGKQITACTSCIIGISK